MTKKSRVILTILASIAALLVVVIVAALIVIQTAWFQNFVREKIISAVEDATGGKVEIGSFSTIEQYGGADPKLRHPWHGARRNRSPAPVDSIDLRIKLLSS